ncbi:uncharacterized protein LOC123538522 [Mercenaria mercenaria]|uniref:uncharacterized protein LOC123538522 n=1 Tax=Mercenaria mercenaria TaxID=6596 RepID=UPI00234F7BD1|nr:uncharacterized protein LOC123538522 [Mercenaria mercenaria]
MSLPPLMTKPKPEDGRKYAYRYYSLITDVGGYVCRGILHYEMQRTIKLEDNPDKRELSDFLKAYRDNIEDYYYGGNNKPVILKKHQHEKLFPERGEADSSKFDLTLILFLLRTCIFCNRSSEAMWRRELHEIYPDSTSVIADLARIRCYRNKFHDIPDTRISLSEEDFWKYWGDLSRIFLHLGNLYDIPGVCKKIYELHHKPLDEVRENSLDDQIRQLREDISDWKEADDKLTGLLQTLDLNQTEMQEQVEKIYQRLDSTARCQLDTKEVLSEKYFVKTEQYFEVKKKLLDCNIVVLNGAPGEGKSTMAKMLFTDTDISNTGCMEVRTMGDIENISFENCKFDAILIDDMFGAGVFDKQESRKWQKILPRIKKWANGSPERKRYVVITSRTYILQEAMQDLYLDNIFGKENIYTLLSNELRTDEKLSILKKHFAIDRSRSINVRSSNSNKEHTALLKKISELELKNHGSSFTVGFPECARLFANNASIYKTGVEFFQKPMVHVMKCISEITENDDVLVAFFVLWAQKTQTLTCRDLERSFHETSDDIKIPISKLQFKPENGIRNIRKVLYTHAHEDGFIIFDTENKFRFSHNVVRDAVGLIAYRRNATAVLELCDVAFIENYVRIQTAVNENESEPSDQRKAELQNVNFQLPSFRYDQLSLRIADLVIPDRPEMTDASKPGLCPDTEINATSLENYSIFKHSIFASEEFCKIFIESNRKKGNLKTILTTELRTITSELMKFKFLELNEHETAVRLPSFLLWQNEQLSILVKLSFHEMRQYPAVFQQETRIALLIASMIGSCEAVEFLLGNGEKVTLQMILLAYEALKRPSSGVSLGKIKQAITLLQKHFGVTKPSPQYQIHIAALHGSLDIVREILKIHPSQAQNTFTFSNGNDLEKASLYHIAAYKQNKKLIDLLLAEKVKSKAFDAKNRSPFLYAIYKGKWKVVSTLQEIAEKHGDEMTPDTEKNTPLHVAIRKFVKEKDETSKKMFRDIAVNLCIKCTKNINMINSKGQTPLHVACALNATDVVTELFKKNIHLAEEERSLMHDFVMSENKTALELLLKKGFDHTITDTEGRTPLMLAEALGKTQVVDIIQKIAQNQNLGPCLSENERITKSSEQSNKLSEEVSLQSVETGDVLPDAVLPTEAESSAQNQDN